MSLCAVSIPILINNISISNKSEKYTYITYSEGRYLTHDITYEAQDCILRFVFYYLLSACCGTEKCFFFYICRPRSLVVWIVSTKVLFLLPNSNLYSVWIGYPYVSTHAWFYVITLFVVIKVSQAWGILVLSHANTRTTWYLNIIPYKLICKTSCLHYESGYYKKKTRSYLMSWSFTNVTENKLKYLFVVLRKEVIHLVLNNVDFRLYYL